MISLAAHSYIHSCPPARESPCNCKLMGECDGAAAAAPAPAEAGAAAVAPAVAVAAAAAAAAEPVGSSLLGACAWDTLGTSWLCSHPNGSELRPHGPGGLGGVAPGALGRGAAVLTVGDGDFSFSRALQQVRLPPPSASQSQAHIVQNTRAALPPLAPLLRRSRVHVALARARLCPTQPDSLPLSLSLSQSA